MRFLERCISLFLLLIIISLSTFGCAEKEALPIHDVVLTILANEGIEKSKIFSLCKRNNEIADKYKYTPIEITENELKNYVEDMLLFHEKMIEITDRNIVRSGDVIVTSYVVYYNSQMVASAEKETLMVGTGNYFKEFEDAIVGAIVGEPFSCILKSPIDTEKYKKGEPLKYNITVESINRFESYTSSDKYILDYYDVNTEEEFFNKCKVKLEQVKRQENLVRSRDEFLDKVAEKCEFYINKDEAAKYSKKIVKQYEETAYISGLELNEYIKQTLKMTEDEFYAYCYDEGVKEIKRYLLVGAQRDVVFDNNENFREFCSMMGYDSTNPDDMNSKYEFLKITICNYFQQKVNPSVTVFANFDFDKNYTVSIYDSSNVFRIDLSANSKYLLSQEIQDNILSIAKTFEFGKTGYWSAKNLYDTVLIFKTDGKESILWLIDNTNGYIKWQLEDGSIAYKKMPKNFIQILNQAKSNQ